MTLNQVSYYWQRGVFLEKNKDNTIFCLRLSLWWKTSCQQTLVAARKSRHLKDLATTEQTNWVFQWTLPDGISFTASQGITACHLTVKMPAAANKDKPRLAEPCFGAASCFVYLATRCFSSVWGHSSRSIQGVWLEPNRYINRCDLSLSHPYHEH